MAASDKLAIRVALIYALIGGLWIVLSDRALLALVSDSEVLTNLQTIKGWLYVLATAFIIYVLVHRGTAAIQRSDEAMLSEEKEKFEGLILATKDAVFETDAEGKFKFVNPAFAKMAGLSSPEEVVGRRATDFWARREDREKYVKELMGKGSVSSYLTKAKRADGSEAYWELSSNVLRGKSGEFAGIRGIIRDVTEREEMQRELEIYSQQLEDKVEERAAQIKVQEKKLRELMENLPAGINVSTPEGRIVEANYAAWRMFGYASKEEFLKLHASALYYNPEDRKKFLELRTGGLIKDFEVRLKRKDGSVFWGSITSIAQTTWSGEAQFFNVVEDITERKQIEEALRTSEERFRTIVENARDVIFTTSPAGIITSLNPAVEAVTGWQRGEWQGKFFAPLIHPADLPLAMDAFQRLLRGDKPPPHELRIRTKSGEYLVGEFVSTPQIENGKVVGILGIARDITEQKRLEEVLRESEEKYRTLIENIQDGVFILQDGKIQYVNEAFVRNAGYSAEEVIGRDFLEFVAPEDLETAMDSYRRRLKGEDAPKEYEICVLRKDGTKIVVNMKIVPITYLGRLATMGTMKDVTERKRVEETLKNHAKQQAAIAKLGQRALIGIGLDTLMNEAVALVAQTLDVEYAKILELQGEDALLLRAGVGWKEGCVGSATVSTGKDSQAGFTLLSSKPVVVEDLRTETRFNGSPLLHEHGVVSGLSVVIHGWDKPYGVLGAYTTRKRKFTQEDVHFMQTAANLLAEAIERKYAEEILKTYAAQLEEVNQLKELFGDIMRHDLLNPITIIKNMTELQLEETRDEETRKTLDVVLRNTDKLIEMIDTASKLAKLESEEKLEFKDLELSAMLRSAAASFQSVLESRKMKLEYARCDECTVPANKVVEDVFTNLISNAIKYSPEGKKIELGAIDEGRSCKIYVKDWGYGIKDRDKLTIFERFTRADKKGIKGTGLGLAIVKRIVDLHRGKVWVEDNPEGGSVFLVELPKK